MHSPILFYAHFMHCEYKGFLMLPKLLNTLRKSGAGERNRTPGLLITSQGDSAGKSKAYPYSFYANQAKVLRRNAGCSVYFMHVFALILATSSAIANDGFYAEIGIGKNGLFQDWWLGRYDVGCYAGAGYSWDVDKFTFDLSYRHSSQCDRGQGYDDRIESVNDSIGLYGRYYFND